MGDEQSNLYQDQQKLAFAGLMAELPNFIAVMITAIVSSSLVMWLDVIDSTGNVLNALLVERLSRKLKSNLKYEYNYGVGKIESIASLSVNALALTGLLVIMIYAVKDLIDHDSPGNHLLIPLLLKLVNIICDGLYTYAQWKICKSSKSILSNTELEQAKRATLFDLITFVTLLITYIFDDTAFASYFSPFISLVLAIFFFIQGIKNILRAIAVLTDKSLPEDQQLLILKAINHYYDDYEELLEINSHLNGEVTTVDLHIRFSKNTTYEEIQTFVCKLNQTLNESISNSVVNVIICEE